MIWSDTEDVAARRSGRSNRMLRVAVALADQTAAAAHVLVVSHNEAASDGLRFEAFAVAKALDVSPSVVEQRMLFATSKGLKKLRGRRIVELVFVDHEACSQLMAKWLPVFIGRELGNGA